MTEGLSSGAFFVERGEAKTVLVLNRAMPNEPVPKPGEPHYRDPSKPRVASPPPPPKRFVVLVRIDAADLVVTPQAAPLSPEMQEYKQMLEREMMYRIMGYK